MLFNLASSFLALFTLSSLVLQTSAAPGYCQSESLKQGCQAWGLDGFFKWTFAARIPNYVSGSTFTYDCIMNNGAIGNGVKALQYSLNRCYITKAADKLKEDGQYGDLTKKAVRVAQDKIGVKEDGVYGPKTREKMSFWGRGISLPDDKCFPYRCTLGGCPK